MDHSGSHIKSNNEITNLVNQTDINGIGAWNMESQTTVNYLITELGMHAYR